MPKWNDYQAVRLQVLEAYRHVEPLEELEPVAGTALQKTRAIHQNMRRKQQREHTEQWRDYFQIGQLWNEEVEHIWNPTDREVCQRALASTLPRYSTRMVQRIYQLFKHKPEAINHFYASPHQVDKLTKRDIDELEEEMRQMQGDFFILGQHLDLEEI